MINSSTKPPIWFWIIAVIALIWNAMGVNQYIQQAYKTDSFKATVTPEQLEMMANVPSWYTAIFAIAVFGGVLGCLLLVLRKKVSYLLFLVSLIAVIIQMSYITFSMKMANIMTPIIVLFAIGLLFLSKYAIRKRWIS